jgi:hypothetical protein
MIDQSLSLVVGVNGPSSTRDHLLKLSSSETRGSGGDSFPDGLSEEGSIKPERFEIWLQLLASAL